MTETEEKHGKIAKGVAKVSFLSGKGGVGKTTFAVNLAKIVSESKRVLLVDCDITSRGASSLLLPKVGNKDITLYAMLCRKLCLFSIDIDAEFEDDLNESFLSQKWGDIFKTNRFPLSDDATITKESENEWVIGNEEKFIIRKEDEKLNIYFKGNGETYGKETLQKIDENLFLLPSIATGQLISWIDYKTEFEDLKNKLSNIIETIVHKYGIDCVVFDCRPGPDPLSGAAAALSDLPIIITEADPVTFEGTMLLRTYLSAKYKVEQNVYFVANRVPEKYDVEDIDYMYREKILKILKVFQVLSYVPFEKEIFESLGEEKFVIEQFPRSILTSKLYVLAHDLFKKRFPDLITPRIKAVGSMYSEKFRKTTKFGIGEQSCFPISISLIVWGVGILLIRWLTLLDDLKMAAVLAATYVIFIILVHILLFSRRFSKILKRGRRTF